jgi:hypothetical protein
MWFHWTDNNSVEWMPDFDGTSQNSERDRHMRLLAGDLMCVFVSVTICDVAHFHQPTPTPPPHHRHPQPTSVPPPSRSQQTAINPNRPLLTPTALQSPADY